jgi:putative acetyltransferase
MFVQRQFRRKGFSEKFFYYLKNLARAKGYRQVILETGSCQYEANLYKKVGFLPIEKYGEYVDDPNSLCFLKEI